MASAMSAPRDLTVESDAAAHAAPRAATTSAAGRGVEETAASPVLLAPSSGDFVLAVGAYGRINLGRAEA